MNNVNQTKLKFKSDIFKSSNKSFYNIFSIYVKMSKNLSAKFYQENKERPQKNVREKYQNEKNTFL